MLHAAGGNCVPVAVMALFEHMKLATFDNPVECRLWILRNAQLCLSELNLCAPSHVDLHRQLSDAQNDRTPIPLFALHFALAKRNTSCMLLLLHHSTACTPASSLLLGVKGPSGPPADALLVYDEARTHISAILWSMDHKMASQPAHAIVAAATNSSAAGGGVRTPALNAAVWRLLAGGDTDRGMLLRSTNSTITKLHHTLV